MSCRSSVTYPKILCFDMIARIGSWRLPAGGLLQQKTAARYVERNHSAKAALTPGCQMWAVSVPAELS